MTAKVLKIALMLYRFPTGLNFSETPITYGICTVPTDFTFLFGQLLPFFLITESMNFRG